MSTKRSFFWHIRFGSGYSARGAKEFEPVHPHDHSQCIKPRKREQSATQMPTPLQLHDNTSPVDLLVEGSSVGLRKQKA